MSSDNSLKAESVNRYTRRVRMYKDGYISVHIFLNVDKEGKKYYDTVVYRKIKTNNGFEHVRGANLKPQDLPILMKLLKEANEFLETEV